MIKHTKPTASSVNGRRGSTSSTQGLLTTILWNRLSTSQDSPAATTTAEPSPLAKVTPVEQVPAVMVSATSSAMDVDGVQAQSSGLEISPTHGKDADDPITKTTDNVPKSIAGTAMLSDAQPSLSKKRWSIFGYGSKEDTETGPSKLRKSGDVLIEPESRPSSIDDAVPTLPTSTSTSTLVAASTTTGIPSVTTTTTANIPTSPSTSSVASASSATSTSSATAKKTAGSGSEPMIPPQNQVTDQIADPSDETGPIAPALVGTSQLNVVVPPGSAAVKIKTGTPTNNTGTVSSSYSWRSIIPGLGNKTEEANKVKEDMVASHQITDYQEGERKDVDGNTISFKEKQPGKTFAQLAEAKNAKENGLAPKDDNKGGPKERQTFAQIKERENQESGVAKEAGKAVASLSKVILRKKNVVLPNYYDQFLDVHPSLITLPEELPLHGPSRARSASIMKSAVNVISNLLFSNPNSPQVPTSPRMESQHRGTNGIKKVAIIGVHGWFPVKLIRTVIGEPTGTSKKFCDEMHSALKEYLKIHNVELEPENCTLIPLEGEGKVLSRVEILYQNLVKNTQWKDALHEADLVLVATHSQGTPTSTLLVARLIEEGMLRVAADDPKMQRVGILAMAGISHGPFPFLKGNLIVRWFEAEAAQELFEFMDSETEIAKKYREALQIVLSSGVRFTCVASLEDQVVPLYSAVMTSIHHPSIVRAVYIDGATYQDDFLTNLISFSLRLRNSGVDDHGVLVHLSEVVAGSIYGEGHSTIYEEREVYLLAIRSLLEPPVSLTPELARSEPILHPFRARQTLNPFYLPWGMRGVMDEIKASGDEALKAEMERLKKLYDEWNPVSKGMKEIKFRLEPLVGHAGIGKRRLASFIRSEITVPSKSTIPAPADPGTSNNGTAAAAAAAAVIATDAPQSFSRSSKSNTDVRFRTAETLPRVIGLTDGQNSTFPVYKGVEDITTTDVNDQTSVIDSVVRYDLILFVVSMANQDSWNNCKQGLLRLDPGWFLGRCAIVITEVANVPKYAFDRDEITDYLDRTYNIPTVWTNLDSTSEATLAATQIIRMLEMASGYRRQNRDYSLASLSQATGMSLPAGALNATFPSAVSLSGLYLGSNLGNPITTTPSFIKSPMLYNVPVTVLGDDDDQEMTVVQDGKSDKKHLRGSLEDEDA
ncbi:hypothetical protein EC991_009203 [Linnemannia zychae]|nr:hypothetical protein EC991_009203 [Linnemannia zychae]